ncbi:MAG TPA: thioredoxin domain-containing protein [Rhizomicrobium sp.]|nr:thioredoxin domain-containing protein [Rhizomicrobium sp.]
MSRNQLDQETSPYLLQHKDNPVHWRPWNREALDEAEATGKPILLSIGYTACHWCHVMNHESFSDAEIAGVINDNFIPIKVDREERPDVDQIYQTVASAAGGQGGWPLTAFLTPNGDPFLIGTYFQPQQLKAMLSEVLDVYRDHGERITANTEKFLGLLTNLWNRDLRGPLIDQPLDVTALRIGQRYDIFFGGLTGQPKFPNFAHVELLLRAFLRTGNIQFNLLVNATLDGISQGGIYDHVGGGIHRYATDERWLLPHFEKMLSDNALYVSTLLLNWQFERNPLHQARVEETIAWVLRDMKVESAFATSLDADTDGEEGRYYVWTEAEIDAALAGTATQRFKQVYNVSSNGIHQGRNVLSRTGLNSAYMISQADEALFAKQRQMLLEVRNKRTPPQRDDKVLADANGMMIAALARAGALFRRTEWTLAAIKAFEFVENQLGHGDRLYHSWRNGRRGKEGFSDDYAHMIEAALALWESTNDKRYLSRAQAWTHTLNEHFWDVLNGGYFSTSDEADPLIIRPRPVFDSAMPCANGLMPGLLCKLYLATLDQQYRARSNAVIEAFSGEVGRAYVSMPSYLNSLDTMTNALTVVIVGPVTNTKTHELVSAVRGRSLPGGLMMLVDPNESLPVGHPAYGKTMLGGAPTAYVCHRMSCSQPINNPVTLSQALQPPLRFTPPAEQMMPPPMGQA